MHSNKDHTHGKSIKRQRTQRKASTRPSRTSQPFIITALHSTTHAPCQAAPRLLKHAPQSQGPGARHPTACNVLLHAIRRRRRRHRPNHRPIVGRRVHRGGQKQAQTMGIQREKHRPRDAVKMRANTITNHSTSVPVHSECTHQPQRRRRHRPGFLRRAMPPAVVRAPAVSLHSYALAQRPHTQQVNQTTAHPTQSTYPSVSQESTVYPHRCPLHHPRPLQNGAPSTHTRPPEPGAGRTPPEGMQCVAARNPPPSPSPPPRSPTYCWAKSSPGGSKTGTDHGNTKRKAQTKGCSENASKHHHQPQ